MEEDNPEECKLNIPADPQKNALFRRSLKIVFHASRCHLATIPNGNCPFPFCGAMTSVLKHVPKCENGLLCPEKWCVTTKKLIYHWKFCFLDDCAICKSPPPPVTKQLQQFANPEGDGGYVSGTSTPDDASTCQQMSSYINNCPTMQTAEEIEALQKEMILVLHGFNCIVKIMKGEVEAEHCGLPGCGEKRQILSHVRACTEAAACTYPMCHRTVQLMYHWRKCLGCGMCAPLKADHLHIKF